MCEDWNVRCNAPPLRFVDKETCKEKPREYEARHTGFKMSTNGHKFIYCNRGKMDLISLGTIVVGIRNSVVINHYAMQKYRTLWYIHVRISDSCLTPGFVRSDSLHLHCWYCLTSYYVPYVLSFGKYSQLTSSTVPLYHKNITLPCLKHCYIKAVLIMEYALTKRTWSPILGHREPLFPGAFKQF